MQQRPSPGVGLAVLGGLLRFVVALPWGTDPKQKHGGRLLPRELERVIGLLLWFTGAAS